MNKTVNINIGGLFFHIDENAYNKLNSYLKAIKESLAEDSKEEVMNDIEIRIGEIFSSRIRQDKQVVNHLDIEYVISIMGQPEDYIIEDDFNKESHFQTQNSTVNLSKKLFRDEDQGRIGGVCAGLGHYFGIDNIWVKLAFIVLFFTTGGTILIIYLALWLLIPKAETTSEKLQMKGEPINISNIEKKIKENFTSEELNRKSKNAVGGIERFLKKFFNVVSKFFGILVLIGATVGLGAIIIFGILLMLASANLIGTIEMFDVPFESLNLFWFALLTTLTAGIPLLVLVLLSFKILNPNLKTLGKYTLLSLLIIWIVSILGWIGFGIKQGMQEQHIGKATQKIELNLLPKDTLSINLKNNTFYSAEETPNFTGKIMLDESGQKVLYSNRVEVILKETDQQPYVLIEKTAKANEIDEATKIAQNIKYNTVLDHKTLVADNYYTSENKSKKNRKTVKLYVYVPKNTILKLNNEAKYYSNAHLTSDQKATAPLFAFNDNGILTCVNCTFEKETAPNSSAINTNLLEKEIDSILNATN